MNDGRGFVIPPRNVHALVNVLRVIVAEPSKFRDMSLRAANYAQQYSLTKLREAIRDLLCDQWHCSPTIFTEVSERDLSRVAGNVARSRDSGSMPTGHRANSEN